MGPMSPTDWKQEKERIKRIKMQHNKTTGDVGIRDDDGDLFLPLKSESSEYECWKRLTSAMQIDGVGCVLMVTTCRGDEIIEQICFVPDTIVVRDANGCRKLEADPEKKDVEKCHIR